MMPGNCPHSVDAIRSPIALIGVCVTSESVVCSYNPLDGRNRNEHANRLRRSSSRRLAEGCRFRAGTRVEKYLAPLIEWARQVYPSATRFEVFTEDDPEIANDRHIVFELDVLLDVE
jgi:hypothetical protein